VRGRIRVASGASEGRSGVFWEKKSSTVPDTFLQSSSLSNEKSPSCSKKIEHPASDLVKSLATIRFLNG
jgi:hypothetical protein